MYLRLTPAWPIPLLHGYQPCAQTSSSRPILTIRYIFLQFINLIIDVNDPTFLVQGEQFCLKYDANSLIYVSKAMDLFDLTHSSLAELNLLPREAPDIPSTSPAGTPHATSHSKSHPPPVKPAAYLPDLARGMARLANTPTLVLGVQSDILFTVEQQREVADALRMAGNPRVSYFELGGVWGHDTFLYVLHAFLLYFVFDTDSYRGVDLMSRTLEGLYEASSRCHSHTLLWEQHRSLSCTFVRSIEYRRPRLK